MKTTKLLSISLLSVLLAVTASADLIALNFGKDWQDPGAGGDPTGNYTSTELGVTVTTWDYESASDWSGNGTTFNAGNGATIGIWHDSANTWHNESAAENSPFHGYLDDGDAGQNYISLTGLSTWLGNSGDSLWRMTVLRSTDASTGFSEIEATTGAVTGETGWLNNSTPTGGSTATSTILGTDFGGAATTHEWETAAFVSDANGIALHYISAGTLRASVAGIIIETIPEPSSMGLLGLGLVLLARHVKTRRNR